LSCNKFKRTRLSTVALVGKVSVKVTNEGKSIIGKALENFSGTKDAILVLVNLQ
jgi:hypothetical protein